MSGSNADISVRVEGGLKWALVVALICLAVYLPGFFAMPVVDRDEARFAQASRQMLESGDVVVPRIQGRDRLNKPPLIYWAQSASAGALTLGEPVKDSAWMYRVPSLLAAVASVLLVLRLGTLMFGLRVGVVAAVMLALSPVVWWEARQARSDMVLLAATTASMLGLWLCINVGKRGAVTGASPWGLALLWGGVAAGVMTKGPITPLVVLLAGISWACWVRRWRPVVSHTAPIFGVVVVVAVAAPWLFAVMQRVGPDVYWKTVFDETLGRSLAPKEGHWGPPGYHSALVWALLFPASLYIVGGLRWAVRHARRERAGAPTGVRSSRGGEAAFLLAWVVPAWIVFEAVSTKLPHYTMVTYPALALLCARAATMLPRWLTLTTRPLWARAGLVIWVVVLALYVIAGFAAAAASITRGKSIGGLGLLIDSVGVVVVLGIIVLARIWVRQRAWGRLRGLSLACAGFVLVMVGVSLPRFDALWVSRSLGQLVRLHDASGQRPLAAAVFHEDSVIFEFRGGIERIEAAEIDDWLRTNPLGLVIMPDAELDARPTLRSLGGVQGINYSKGRRVYLSLVEVAASSDGDEAPQERAQ
ncbi:MAG: glycosyltransferase family 39 protein [Phycisphaeraceae bacterium]|nr:glycosyltransferase family 39 protein [Phycisphaeraceae bacterium]